jgi:hypothetical protein
MTNSPVWSAATVTAIVSALITLLVAFGVPINQDQTAALMGFVAVVAPIAVAWVASPRVTSLKNPQDEDGTPLRRVDDAPTNAQVRSMKR